jgi:ABC-type branched-subunit amino acid transport system permease subunit
MVRPGECVDLYYYDAETSKKQCFPTTQNTKYVQQFANLTGGTIPGVDLVVFGVLLILCVAYAPRGVLGLAQGWLGRLKGARP